MSNQFFIDYIITSEIPGVPKNSFSWMCSGLDAQGELEHYTGTTRRHKNARWSSSAEQVWPTASPLDAAAKESRRSREQELARRMSMRLERHFAGRDPGLAALIQRASEKNRHLSLRIAKTRPSPFVL